MNLPIEERRLVEWMQALMQCIMEEASYTLGLSGGEKMAEAKPCSCSMKIVLAQILLCVRKGRGLNFVEITFMLDEQPVHVLVNVKKIISML